MLKEWNVSGSSAVPSYALADGTNKAELIQLNMDVSVMNGAST